MPLRIERSALLGLNVDHVSQLDFSTVTRGQVSQHIKNISRKNIAPNQPHQAKGVNHGLLLEMIGAQPRSLVGQRNCALLSLGYDLLARRSELTALKFKYLEFLPDSTLRGMIPKGKADQSGYGWLTFGSHRSAELLKIWLKKKPKSIHWVFCLISHGNCLDRHLCDRSAYEKEIAAVFCAINHGQCLDRPICDRNVSEIIKKSVVKVKRCERPSDLEVSGHSLRVGAAPDLLIKGYDLAAIMRAGGWSNAETVSRYLRFSQHNIWA